MNPSLILGIDPGFSSMGFAVYDVAEPEGVVGLGVIRTAKSDKKRRVLASDDNLRRTVEIHDQLAKILRGDRFVAICAESMSFPRNASTSAKIGIAWGVIGSISRACRLPVVQASPQEIKKKICGRKDASKEEVEEALRASYPGAAKVLGGVPPSLHNHAWDALGAVVACLDGDVLMMARRLNAV